MKGNGKGFQLSLTATNGEKRNTDVEAMGEYVNIMSKLPKVDQFTSSDAWQNGF
jgi:hypothetical protein